jgi:outer membrane protein OmpA-like peptidoglycan-associated protein
MKRLSLLFCLMLLSLPVVPAQADLPGFMLAQMGTLNGQIFVDDKPLPKAIVAFFPAKRGLPPLTMDMISIPEFMGLSDADGKFSIKLMPGTYYLGMLIRETPSKPGPPRPGEPFFFAAEPSGSLRQFTLGTMENLEIGRVDGAKTDTFKEISDTFLVKGAVVDDQGQPFPEVLIFAKENLSQPRPDFISERTGKDGLFALRVPAGRTYYLFARPSIGFRKPAPGESMGVYGIKSANGLISPVISGVGGPPPGVDSATGETSGNNPKPVTAGSTEIVSGIEIVMYKIPDAEELKSSLQGKNTSPMFELGANLNNIYFALNSDRLEERSFAELDKWATFLNGSPDITLEISGHTDNTGSPAYNRKLSEKRAIAVAKYLQGKDVNAQRVTTIGYGPDHPVDDNTKRAGREKNRRVEIRFIQ